MDLHGAGRLDRAHEFDVLAKLRPWSARRDEERLDPSRGHKVRVAGVVDVAVDDVSDVAPSGDVGVDDRMLSTDHGHAESSRLKGVAGLNHDDPVTPLAELCDDGGGSPDPQLGLGVESCVQDASVKVVRVIVRNDYDRGRGYELGGIRSVRARVDHEGVFVFAENDGGMGVFREVHVGNYTGSLYSWYMPLDAAPSHGQPDFTIDDANELRRAIGESVRVIRRSEPTPEGQIEALGFLVRDGAHSIAALARLRKVRHQSMSATVADLEEQGLVKRAADPSDARGLLVSLTAAGSEMIAESRIRRSGRIFDAAHRALSPDERATLAAASAALDKLTAALLAE
jgi:DNA-binding MarR family transcriptional regulator